MLMNMRTNMSLKFQTNDGTTAVSMVPNVRRQPTRNIEQWTTAYKTSVAIYKEKYSNETPNLMKCSSVIRELVSQSANWKFYDENFQLLRQKEPWPWSQIYSELYLRAHLTKSKFISGPRGTNRANA